MIFTITNPRSVDDESREREESRRRNYLERESIQKNMYRIFFMLPELPNLYVDIIDRIIRVLNQLIVGLLLSIIFRTPLL